MIREVNFQTTLGIDTPASKWLWDVTSQDERNELMKFIGGYTARLKKYSNDGYVVELIFQDYLEKANRRYRDEKYYSLVENLLKTFRKRLND